MTNYPITLKLNNNEIVYNTRNCLIIGENGSGKSSMIHRFKNFNNDKKIEFILAKKNLTFLQESRMGLKSHELKNYSQQLYNSQNSQISKDQISQIIDPNNYSQTDFDIILEDFAREFKNKFTEYGFNDKSNNRPDTKLEKLLNIWNKLFNPKKISFLDGKLKVNTAYEIENLSDGERSALYLIMRCIDVEDGSYLIVDECETHLNSALLQELWDEIENYKKNIHFIYLTHDLEFALSRTNCTKFWIKEFSHPDNWILEEINNDDIPDDLIIKIIGSKKTRILFVEGQDHTDRILYQKIFPDFKVYSVGSCENVKNFTQALNNSIQKYNKEYYGLIDRDFKSEEEIISLNKNKIMVLPVAEIENIFYHPDIIRKVFEIGGMDGQKIEEIIEQVKNSSLNLFKSAQFQKDYIMHELKQQFNLSLNNFDVNLYNFKSEDKINAIKANFVKFSSITDFIKILSVLNCKQLKGIKIDIYSYEKWRDKILALFNTNEADKLGEIFKNVILPSQVGL